MKELRRVWAVVSAVAVALGAGATARSAAHVYSDRVETIRCGVLLANSLAWGYGPTTVLGNQVYTSNPFAYVFYALDSRADVRPYGWEIVNPYAAPFMDQAMATRYNLGTLPAGAAPRLNKNNGAYWEVFLKSISSDQLSNYDVLYMPLPLLDGEDLALTVEDREKLRRAVDGGTVLWIDTATPGPATTPSPAKLFIQPQFQAGANNNRGQVGDPMNALLNSPYQLSGREIRQLGQGNATIGNITSDLPSTVFGGLAWKFVAQNTAGKPTIAVASYGQGAVVVTSRGLGRELSASLRPVSAQIDPLYRSGNVGAASGSDSRMVPMAELKFLVNLIAYRFQSPQTGMGPRHSSGSRQDLNTPLGTKWQFPENFVANPGGFKFTGTPFVSDPVVWNGILYAASSDGYLRAYDMDPGRDLDGDGNPDDGLPNPARPGSDVIWEAALPAPRVCSSLVVADTIGRPVLYGMLADGKVFMADALPRNNAGRISGTPAIRAVPVEGFGAFPPLYSTRMTTTPATAPGEEKVFRIPAPVFYNGRLFVVGVRKTPDSSRGIGALAEVNPSTLQTMWQFPDKTTNATDTVPPQSRMGMPSATPTVGALPDKGYTGATDIMLLVPTFSIRPSDNVGQTQASRLMAFPIGVRGEQLQKMTPENDTMPGFYTRFAGANALHTTPVMVYGSDGTIFRNMPTAIEKRGGLNRLYVDFSNVTVPDYLWDNLRADYDFVPDLPSNDYAGYNARWSFDAWSYIMGTINKFMEITTTPVLDADGGIYFVANDLGDGGNQQPMVLGLETRPQNLGFNVLNNPNYLAPLNIPQLTFIYSMGSSSGTATAQAAAVAQPVVLGTPAVDRGILYAAWGAWDPSNKANSNGGVTGFYVRDTKFGLLLANPVDPAQKNSITMTQRNFYTGDPQNVGYGLFDVDNINIGGQLRCLITFRTLSSGAGATPIDLSRVTDIRVTYQGLDITTGKSGQVVDEIPTAYYKTARGEGYDQSILLAFNASVPGTGLSAAANGRGIRTGVTVAGGAIYVGSDSGDIWTVALPTDLDVAQKQAAVMRQATFPNLTSSAGFPLGMYPAVNPSGDPNMGSAMRANPVISSGTLVINAPVGIYSYYSPRTLITDANRIIEVASSYAAQSGSGGGIYRGGSSVVWSLDSTTQTRDLGSAGIGPEHEPGGVYADPVEKALSQPTMAIRVNSTNTLICDTGNNRVVEVDRGGRVVWQATEFADPYGLLGPNESHSLSSPTSVQRWESYTFDETNNNYAPSREQHTLIADYGNNRVLELVTRFSRDPAEYANNIVVWVGKGPEGKGYKFYQAQREPLRKPGDPDDGSLDFGHTIASVTNLQVNGAEAKIDGFADARTQRPATPGGSLVLLTGRKDTSGGAALPRDGRMGYVFWFLNQMTYASDSQVFPLARPVYFNRYTTGAGAFMWRVTMTDGQNVFDLVPDENKPGVAHIPVGAGGPIVAYKPFGSIGSWGVGSGGLTVGISMAKVLSNGDVLMVNQKTGYVLEYAPAEAAAAAKSGSADLSRVMRFTAPPISGTGALVRPSYADRLY